MYASGAQVYICVFQPGIIESLLLATVKRPWLWGVYVFAVGLPAILFISFMWPDKVKYEWLCEYGFVCFGLARQIVKLQYKKNCVCLCVRCLQRFGPPDQEYYYKKSDEDQPDDLEFTQSTESVDIKGNVLCFR